MKRILLAFALLAGGLASAQAQYIAPYSGAVSRTNNSKMADIISVFDFIPVSLQAAIKAGTSTTDVSSYLTAMHAAVPAGVPFLFPAGQYNIGAGSVALTGRVVYTVGATFTGGGSITGALFQSTSPTWTGLNTFNTGWVSNISQPTLQVPFPSMNGDPTTPTYYVGSSNIVTWTGSTALGATALTGQTVISTTANIVANNGEVGGVFGGALNQKSGAHPYGVLGVTYNDANATPVPGGVGVWGIVRGVLAGINSTGINASSEVVAGQHPLAGLLVNDLVPLGTDDSFLSGVHITSAKDYGINIGTQFGSGSGTIPTYPFAVHSTPGNLTYFIKNDSTVQQLLTANNLIGLKIKRFTDAAPTGKFLDFTDAANASVYSVDVSGNVTANSFTGPALSIVGPGIVNLGVAGAGTGKIQFGGLTSGVAILTTNDVAGTPTVKIGTTSGTLVSSAALPLSIDAATGVISIPNPLGVANGGSGLATLTANAIYKGNGTSALALSSITDDGTTFAIASTKFTVNQSTGAALVAGQITADTFSAAHSVVATAAAFKSSAVVSLATGAQNTIVIPNTHPSSLVFVTESAYTGANALWLLAGGTPVLISQVGTSWVAATTTPASDKFSIAHDGSNYRIYSNGASAPTFKVLSFAYN